MANYGQYTGYEPVPDIPGAFSFQTANGKPVVAGGQAAADLKARLDAANAATQTAGHEAAGGYGDVSKLGNFDKGPLPATAFPGPAAPAMPEPAPPAGPQPHMVNGINTGRVVAPDGRLLERVGGSAGVSQEKLQEKAGQGTALPTGESETKSGGYEQNQDYIDAGRKNTDEQVRSLNTARDAEVTAQESGRAVAGDQFIAATAARDEAQALAQRMQAGMQEQQAIRDQAVREYTGTKIDPDRVFSGGLGFAKRLGAALAAGFGAYGAAINHTENFAGKVVDQMIERDIHAQEVDLRTKKDAADNALSDLMRKGMSLDQAKNTLGVIQKDWARQQLELAKGQSGSDVINAKYDAQIGKIMQDRVDADEKYRLDSEGKVTKAVQSQVMYPQAATAGGWREVSPDKAMQVAGQTANADSTVVGTKKTAAELQNGGDKVTPNKAKAIAGIHASKAALLKLKEKWIKAGKPGVLNTGYFGSDVSQSLGADVESLAPGLGRGLEGNAPNESTMDAIRKGILSGDPTKVESSINSYLERLDESEQSLASTPGDIGEDRPPK